jgi:hypothetical protein
MDTRTSFIEDSNIFIDNTLLLTTEMAGNKLFATFSKKEDIEQTLETITGRYSILYNKIFILESKDSDEFICTYNIDPGNMSTTTVLPNTILLHRKKESNSLYTINALNALVKTLNNGYVDPNYKIDWNDYKNTILLTQGHDQLRKLETTIYKIVNL